MRGVWEFGCGRTERWCARVVDEVGLAVYEMSKGPLDDVGSRNAPGNAQRAATPSI